MIIEEYRKSIEGYAELEKEIQVLKKHDGDYALYGSSVSETINLYHPKRLSLKVTGISQATQSAKTFKLVSTENYLPPFQAGQYINLFVEVDGVRTSRPYSIASPPNQGGYYEITVRRVNDGFISNYLLDEVKAGDVFESTSPSGHFHYNPLFHGKDLVFLAGGSGITPFMSMIREVTDRGLDRRIHIIYGSRNEDDIIYRRELEDRAKQNDNLTVSFVISEPPAGYQGLIGFISAELMKKLINDLPEKMFYICGPEVMYTFCLPELEKMNVMQRKIRTEVFGQADNITAQPGWPEALSADTEVQVKIKGKKTISVVSGEPLLNSLERNGLVVPTNCRSGECSICRVKLLSGRVFQPTNTKLRKSDRQYGYIHSCSAYPLEDLEILI